jgi:hypothetical protein
VFALGVFGLRRTLGPWLPGALALFAWLAARAALAGTLDLGPVAAPAASRALVRQNAWSVLFLAAPLLFLRAASLGRPAANAWLSPSGSSPRVRALTLLAGIAAACALATVLVALIAEFAVQTSAPARQRNSLLPSPAAVLTAERPRFAWQTPPVGEGAALRLWTTVAVGSGPAVTARLTARAGAWSEHVEARVAGRTALELGPGAPPGHPVELVLERLGEGALLVVPPEALESLLPVASERLSSCTLSLAAWLTLAAGSALAFGLARRLRPALAASSVATLLFAARSPWLPDWGAAWSDLGEGLVPGNPAIPAWLGAGGLFLIGFLLQGRGGGRA